MIKDITIGQYFATNSVIHKIDPRMKILVVTIYIIDVFLTKNLNFMFIPLFYLICAYIASKISFKLILKSIIPMVPIILVTAIFNLFFIDGETIYKFYFIEITKEGLIFSFIMVSRIILLILGTSLLTYTTSPIELTDAIENLLKPLKIIKFPVQEISMMMTISLRFIPTLLDEIEKIIDAQKSRGSDIDTGKFTDRIKAMVPILIPIFISSFKRADDLALAMECRCYCSTNSRTKLKSFKYIFLDYFILFITIVMTICIIYLNYFK